MINTEISDLLRRRIVADLHLGRLKPGARLPSLRTVAHELNVSIRAAARAYASLERDGLVTVRGRSGIYLVAPFAVDIHLEQPLAWYADMLKDAWTRRIGLTEVTGVLQQLVDHPLRAACVESTEDHMVAFCAELEADFALTTSSVKLNGTAAAVVNGEPRTLPDALAEADFIVTTAFHATDIYDAAELLKKPVVVVSVNETLVDSFESQLEAGPVTVIAQDPAFVQRFRTYLLERFRNRGDLAVVAMDDIATQQGTPQGTLLYTRAARRQLQENEYHLVPPPVAFLSDRAVRKVLQCMLSTHAKRALQPA